MVIDLLVLRRFRDKSGEVFRQLDAGVSLQSLGTGEPRTEPVTGLFNLEEAKRLCAAPFRHFAAHANAWHARSKADHITRGGTSTSVLARPGTAIGWSSAFRQLKAEFQPVLPRWIGSAVSKGGAAPVGTGDSPCRPGTDQLGCRYEAGEAERLRPQCLQRRRIFQASHVVSVAVIAATSIDCAAAPASVFWILQLEYCQFGLEASAGL